MAANSVDSDQYEDGSIDVIHMSVNSVDSAQYADESIDIEHMSSVSVDSDNIVEGTIVVADMNVATTFAWTATHTFDDVVVDGVLDTGTLETFGVSDATPDVGTGSFFITNATQGVPITDFDGAGILAGQIITV